MPHAEILEFVGRTLAPDFPLKLIVTSGGIRPNALLRHGDADANFFQHEPFLHAEEAQLGVTFAVVPAVHIEPLGIYSRCVATLAEVPQGASVTLPNKVTNFSRGLKLLQESGLIRLRPGDGTFATVQEVAENPKSLCSVEIAPAQLPRSLDDVSLAVINSNHALETGLIPARDALALERTEGNPYANVLVTTQALAGDERILRLAALLTSAEVSQFIRDCYRGSVIPVRTTRSDTSTPIGPSEPDPRRWWVFTPSNRPDGRVTIGVHTLTKMLIVNDPI